MPASCPMLAPPPQCFRPLPERRSAPSAPSFHPLTSTKSQKNHPVLFRTKTEIFEFLDSQRDSFALKRMCALYGVTRAGDYAWRQRGESARRRQDRVLLDQIQALFDRSRDTYGSPRIHRALAAGGVRVSRRRIARLMRETGLRARVVTGGVIRVGDRVVVDQAPVGI